MHIEDIVNLTEGTLINTPAVHSIEAATVYQSKVEQGDLFFSNSQEDIDKAIQKGAYAIVYDDPSIIRNDEEIAWIRVDNLQKAAIRVLRYVAIQKEAKFYYLEPHEKDFLKMILTQKRHLVFLENDWRKTFESVVNGNAFLFISDDKSFLQAVKPDFFVLEDEADGYIVSATLFKTTFKVDNFIYQEKEMAPFHLPHLLRSVAFAKEAQLPYQIERIRYTKHFVPVFIDGKLTTVPKGQSDKAAVFVDNFDDIQAATEYLRSCQQWVKSIILTPSGVKLPWQGRPVWYENETHLRSILKESFFNYAFVYHANRSVLKQMQETSNTLFSL